MFCFSYQNFLDQICKQDHYYFFRNSVRSAFDEDVASEARMTTGLFSKMSKPKAIRRVTRSSDLLRTPKENV